MAAIEENNKTLVLEVFDTFFNKRDYEAVARFCSPNYIQHSAHIELRHSLQDFTPFAFARSCPAA